MTGSLLNPFSLNYDAALRCTVINSIIVHCYLMKGSIKLNRLMCERAKRYYSNE